MGFRSLHTVKVRKNNSFPIGQSHLIEDGFPPWSQIIQIDILKQIFFQRIMKFQSFDKVSELEMIGLYFEVHLGI